MIKLKTLSQIVSAYRARQHKTWLASIAVDRAAGYQAGYLKGMQDVKSVIADGLNQCYTYDAIVSHVRAAVEDETRLN